jgi:maltose alpha-D-glucosyltransferase/alpha-amylase
VLVVDNLSRHPQYAEIDLRAFAGDTTVEIICRTRFPTITDRPYMLSFGPHTFLWFQLEPAAAAVRARPTLRAVDSWTAVADDRRALAHAIADYASERRWFRSKARTQRRARIVDLFELTGVHSTSLLVVLEIEFADADPESYLVPIGFLSGEPSVHLEHRFATAVIANLDVSGRDAQRGILYDTLVTGEAAQAFLALARSGGTLAGPHGRLVGHGSSALQQTDGEELSPRAVELEQTNSTIPFGDKIMLKVFRELESGPNAEIEIGRYLSEQPAPATRIAPLLGSVSYERTGEEPAAAAILHATVPNQGSAWTLFAGELNALFENAIGAEPPPLSVRHPLDLLGHEPPAALVERAGHYLRHAALLGRRTAEVHVALAAGKGPAFAPEKYTVMYQQSLFQGARATMVRTFEALAKRLDRLPQDVQEVTRAALAAQPRIEDRLRAVQARPVDAIRIRVHGDLHLGQVLFTGDDFAIIDFEGEPARPLRERRYKRVVLRDVAGMLRSFSYAAESALRTGVTRLQDQERARPWGAVWSAWVSTAYLAGYFEIGAPLAPADPAVRRLLLDFHMMEKCIYEIAYELNNRPEWLPIPLRGLLDLIA